MRIFRPHFHERLVLCTSTTATITAAFAAAFAAFVKSFASLHRRLKDDAFANTFALAFVNRRFKLDIAFIFATIAASAITSFFIVSVIARIAVIIAIIVTLVIVVSVAATVSTVFFKIRVSIKFIFVTHWSIPPSFVFALLKSETLNNAALILPDVITIELIIRTKISGKAHSHRATGHICVRVICPVATNSCLGCLPAWPASVWRGPGP
ncbi:MAG: hypothetical protein LBV27_03010 [Oscillospiraceae bacterium]|jgi:hypothetical protein|nr:hypothetical protein [Oscillospiraceae bacterium]